MSTLRETLHDHTVDDLKKRLALLDIKLKAPRKVELVELLEKQLTGSKLISTWNRLSTSEQTALRETCYATGLVFNEVRIAAKHGRCAPLFIPDKSASRWSRSGKSTLITLFLYFSKYERTNRIPSDLAAELRKYVPAPAPLTVVTLASAPDGEGMTVRPTEHDALREVSTLLRLAEQGNFRSTPKTGLPAASGKKAIHGSLSGGDFFPPEVAHLANKESWTQEIGEIKAIGWVRFFLTAKLVSPGGTRSSLTPAGIKALSKSPHRIIQLLWKKWLTNDQFDEFNRVDTIQGQKAKGHMTAKPPRRSAIARALEDCPANKWIDVKTFSSYMLAQDFTFEVSRDPWKLFLCDREYGALGYAGSGGWDILQFRYLLVLLFEYAATLGLIDIAYVHPSGALNDYQNQWGADDLEWLSRYDGLRAFRITNLGACCFGLTDSYVSTQPETSLKLKVSASLTLHLLSEDLPLSERMLIETWASPSLEGRWQLDPARTRDAIERGNKIEDFISFLEKSNGKTIPKSVEKFLKIAFDDAHALKRAGEATFFDCRDAKTADLILKQKTLKAICFRCSDTRLAIPAEHLLKFQKHIRKLGLGFA